MTTPAQLAELSKAATRTAYFAEFQFRSGTSRLSSLNFNSTWGDSQYMLAPGVSNNAAITPDAAVLDITGDLDVLMHLSADDWTPAAIMYQMTKWSSNPTGSWFFGLRSAGTLLFDWIDGGGVARSTTSSVAVPTADGVATWIRATIDVNNGAGGHTVTFYTSPDNVVWTQLGATQNAGAFTTAIQAGSDPLDVGAYGLTGSGSPFKGKIYYGEVRNGIGGTAVAIFNAQDALIGASSWVSSVTGETWTLNTSGGSPAAIAGGVTWTGLGSIGAIDAVQESDSLDAKALTFTLNVAQPAILALAAGDVAEYRGRTAKLYFCPLDESFQLVGTPERCWSGIMDTLAIGLDGENGGISLRCEGSAYALKKRPSLRLNAAQQKARHPADTGLDYLTDLISKPQLWASKRFQKSLT